MSYPSGGQSDQQLARLENEIDMLLRRSMQTHVDESNTQISRPQLLQDILSKKVIKRLFREYRARIPSWEDENVDELCNEVHQNHIIVLAILILFRKGHTIIKLRDGGVSDANLPLIYYKIAQNLYLETQPHTPLPCFPDTAWNIQMRQEFCRIQWYLNVPYMKMEVDSAPEHTDFPPRTVLPWCMPEDTAPHKDQSASLEKAGGYSRVRLVHIHQDYHNFHEILNKIGLNGCSNNFALKILKPVSEKDLEEMYQNEVEHLKNFNGKVARHLVTLLTTFTHRDDRHFLFPWADCDLFSYWKTERAEPLNSDDVRWLSKQLMGIVEAVHAIHYPPRLDGHPRKYGRHGDLKPDNILWYKKYNDDPKGILVVSDMGFAVAHHTWSRSQDRPSQVARTPDYRPPEMDTKDKGVSPKYDIWTLGCIFLEMLTWFLGGEEERRKSKQDRTTPELPYGGRTCTFFTLSSLEGGYRKANVKQSVLDNMEKIRNHEYRSRFTDDVVNIIQDHMIRVVQSERADTVFLKEEFTDINEKCERDLGYCTP